jgi:hypothetical protein
MGTMVIQPVLQEKFNFVNCVIVMETLIKMPLETVTEQQENV